MVAKGYKQTEIGVIPKDWKLKTLGESFSFKNGLNKAKKFFGHGTPIVNYMDVFNYHGLRKQNILGKVEVTKEEEKNYLVQKGDVFFTRTSETVDDIGITTVVIEDVNNTVFSGFVLRARPIDELYELEFKKYCFSSKLIRNQIISTTSYTTRALTNGTLLSKILIPIPPKQEQKAIAQALSDIDALITSLEKLIVKKKHIKTAIMQQLLTGRKRLDGFSGEWEERSILSIVDNIIDYRGVTPKKKGMEWGNGNIVALSAGNVKKGYIDFDTECYYGSEELYKKWMTNGNTKKDDIVFTMEAPLGNIALIPDNKKYILSQRTILLQVRDDIYSPYIYQLFLSQKFQNYLYNVSTGSTAKGIKRKIFEKLLITIPFKSEQKAIAQILSDMDEEIETLKTKLKKTQNIKIGMMQELLTGKTRLK